MRRSTKGATSERTARGLHAPTIEIYLQAHVAHAPVRGCRMGAVLVVDRSGDTYE
jgi:hypothetical protein